jgi:hypothetical protein
VSKIGVQVVPPLVDRHTPPWAVPRYTLLEFVGSTATAVARPVIAAVVGNC